MSTSLELQALQDLDIDLSQELARMTEGLDKPLPRIRIEHSPSGRHQMLIDYGPTLEEDHNQVPVPKSVFRGVILISQQVRAVFEKDATLPTCASVDKIPTVESPRAFTCDTCEWNAYGSPCKEKTRLLVVDPTLDAEHPLYVFPLSPTSIKHWKRYIHRLSSSRVPYLVVLTRFELLDVQRNGYRWAEIVPVAERLVTQDELAVVKELRQAYDQVLSEVKKDDYQDPGDANDEG